MIISLSEVCEPKDKGSMGAQYVAWSLENAGYTVNKEDYNPCDIELLSVHHVSDYERLKKIPKRGKIRIVGGHPCAVNPRPIIPFADVICVGEGETWVVDALKRLEKSFDLDSLKDLSGTIICKDWKKENDIPKPNIEKGVPDHPAYLNKAIEGHAQTWYLEIARGCPWACHYCELGNTLKYRHRKTEQIIEKLEGLDKKITKKISFFAPDIASHPGYDEILRTSQKMGFITQFGSMRVEQIMKKNIPLKGNMLVRVGMDGLSEETRFKVGRKQTDVDFIRYFRKMSEDGHTNFKIFMIVGYPWETEKDLDCWIKLMSKISQIDRRTNAHVRIKITPFIPQPTTPLKDSKAKYDMILIKRMEEWIKKWKPKRTPGWFFEQDGCVMSWKNWKKQCELTNGDEESLI